jgi:F0F1-type ATP synthase assembly protein I
MLSKKMTIMKNQIYKSLIVIFIALIFLGGILSKNLDNQVSRLALFILIVIGLVAGVVAVIVLRNKKK